MEILSSSRKYLRYAGLGTDRHIHVAGKHLPRTFVRCVIMGAELSVAAMFIMIVHKNMEHGLQAILFPLHMLMLACVKISFYTTLMVKSARMAEIIDYCNDVVDRRRQF